MKVHPLIENFAIAFAMRCDQDNLTVEDGEELAELISDALMGAAEDRSLYAQHAKLEGPQ